MRRNEMKRKFIGLLVILAIVSLLFTACQRPATISPTSAPLSATATKSEGDIPFPVATQPSIMADILQQTQTALALTPQSGGDFPMITSTPAFVFNTPTDEGPQIFVTNTPEIGGTTPAVGGEVTATPSFTNTPIILATATATKMTYPTPTPGRPATYTIQAGEYLWCIARRFDVSIDSLYSANGMNYASQPQIGTVLTIPSSGSFGGSRARNAHPATYTVRAGDTMGSIACWYGDADPNTIYAANGLAAGSVIVVGQVLQIP
jgi:LysM repeat protein